MSFKFNLYLILIIYNLIFKNVNLFNETNVRVKRQYNVEYGNPSYKYCQCGKSNLNIYENIYPWIALIKLNSKLISEGSLINDRYVITAAHITELNNFKVYELKVILGKSNICEEFNRQTVELSVENLIKHPQYNPYTLNGNIMLIKLNMKVTFNEYIRPICLPKYNKRFKVNNKYMNEEVSSLGWGLIRDEYNICFIQAVNYLQYCNANKSATVVCASGINIDTCMVDSGSPIQIKSKSGKYELVGIVSSRIACGVGVPIPITDLLEILSWIINITTRDSLYCWR